MDIFDKCFQYNDSDLVRAAGLYPYFHTIAENYGAEVTIDGRRVLMAGSNNYLGLTTDPRVKEAAIEAVRRFGTSCSGSRLLNGTLALHEELEQRLAKFLRKEAALVFSTGFQTNQGTLAPLLGRHDVAFVDRSDHASIIDGVRLGLGELRRFRHNDLEHLEQLLRESEPDTGKLIVVDGVFSMEGDTADLAHIVELKRAHGARLMVDDAHGIGVLGHGGRGTAEHFGVEDDVDLIMGTFSKSLASLGGVVAGPRKILDYVKHKSRALIFSASMTPAAVGACMKALEIIELEPERRVRLWRNTERARAELRRVGFDTGVSTTPVVPVIVGDDLRTFQFWRALLDGGVFTNPIISPAVAPGMQLIRTSFTAAHTDEQVDHVLEVMASVGRRLGIIGESRSRAAVG